MWLSGGTALWSSNEDVVISFGAKVNSLIATQHQPWRLVTCMFIHIGLAHLIMNNYALWILGREIEQIYGSSRFVLLYLAAGVAGSLSSYVFMPNSTSAGASGAIFGLFGVMGTFAFRYRSEIPAALRRDIIRRIIPIILINLGFGFAVKFVDNSAHIGGLAAGVVLALVVPYKRPGELASGKVWKAAEVVCLVIIALCFIEAFRHYDGPRPSLANLTADPEQNNPRELAIGKLVDSLTRFRKIVRSQDPNADPSAALRAVEGGIKDIERVRSQDPMTVHIKELLSEQKAIIERYAKANPKDWRTAEAEEEALIRKGSGYKLIEDK